MAVMHRSGRERLTAKGERERRERQAQAKAAQERGAREWEALKVRVRADRKARAEAIVAEEAELAAMSPAQLAAREQRLQSHIPKPGPGLPDGYWLASEELDREAREEKDAERKQLEHDAGLPKRQVAWEARREQIDQARADAIRKAGERCRADEQTARDKAQHELEELGERPTLDALEVAAI